MLNEAASAEKSLLGQTTSNETCFINKISVSDNNSLLKETSMSVKKNTMMSNNTALSSFAGFRTKEIDDAQANLQKINLDSTSLQSKRKLRPRQKK